MPLMDFLSQDVNGFSRKAKLINIYKIKEFIFSVCAFNKECGYLAQHILDGIKPSLIPMEPFLYSLKHNLANRF